MIDKLFHVIDCNADEIVFTIAAPTLEAAKQEADCCAAEAGWDREYDYAGFTVIPKGD